MDQNRDLVPSANVHLGPVQDLSYSKMCESGYYLASGCQEGRAMIRRGDTGEGIGTFEGHKSCIWGVSLNADATRLVTGSDDKTVRLWNATDGSLIKRFRQTKPVSCVDIDRESKHFLAGNLEANPVISFYDMEVLSRSPVMEFRGHTRGVRNVSFCHNGSSLVSSSYDRSILLWDCRNGKQSSSIMLPHHAKSLELCADGQTLTICYGESIIFLNVDRFEVLEHHKMPLKMVCASLHPEKRTFVCCGSDHCIYKYDYLSGLLLDRFEAHNGNIRTIKYSPDGEKYASCANSGDIVIWPQQSSQNHIADDSSATNEDDHEWDELRFLGYEYYHGGDDNGEEEYNEDDYNEEGNDEELNEIWDTAPEESLTPTIENSDEDSSEQFDAEVYDDDDDEDDDDDNEEEQIGEEEFEEEAYNGEEFDEEFDDEETNNNEEDYNESSIWNSAAEESFPSIDEIPFGDYYEQFGTEDDEPDETDEMQFEYDESHESEFDETMYDQEYDY